MKKTFVKALGLMLVLTIVLTGCNLIEIDPMKQSEEDVAKLTKAYSVAVATYDGGEVTAEEAMNNFYSDYTYLYQIYAYYLNTTPDEDTVHETIETAIGTRVTQEILAKHFDESNALTDEEIAEAEASAQNTWDTQYEEACASVDSKKENEKKAKALTLMKTYGLDINTLKANAVIDAKAEKMKEAIKAEIESVTDEQLQAAYDEKVAADQETYTNNPSQYGSDMTSADAQPYWTPEGYRTVKHILVNPEEAVMTAYTDAVSALSAKETELKGFNDELAAVADNDSEDARTAEQIQADIDACNAAMSELQAAVDTAKQACIDNVKATTDAIYAKLAEDASPEAFAALIAEYGQDPGMQNEPTATIGYYVSAASTNWQQSFTDASMALETVGSYTAEPVVSGSGVHIIMYMSDVASGATALETVKEALTEETLTNLKEENYSARVEEWTAAANVSEYNTEAFETAFSTEA